MTRSIRHVAVAVLLIATAQAAAQIEERATEEIFPGVRVRGGTAVVMDVGEKGCEPACEGEQVCRYDCRPAACEPGTSPQADCSRCDWRCVD